MPAAVRAISLDVFAEGPTLELGFFGVVAK